MEASEAMLRLESDDFSVIGVRDSARCSRLMPDLPWQTIELTTETAAID